MKRMMPPNFNGYIDSIALYNTALTAEEILALTKEEPPAEDYSESTVDFVNVSGKTVETQITNNTSGVLDYTLIVNVSGEDRFDVACKSLSLASRESKILSLEFDEDIDPENHSVKVFIWDKISNLMPLGKAVENYI